jgi:XRE family transcriptional regulator, aerobic/anaerobic benzoate catabolism transcriptional regulator
MTTQSDDPETGFLEQLGQRVRTMRALRGMSRKVLAKVSGISERYIAQLESGKGNVSIVLLRRVSNAMGAHLEDLIPDGEPAPDWPVIRDLLRKATPSQIAQAKDILSGSGVTATRRPSFAGIALIGLRGAGKSTLGAQLAAERGVAFVELDREIEREAGTSMNEILLLHGQAGYRRYERRALLRIAEDHADGVVMTTGGSIVSEHETFDLLQSHFYCVWLKASPEEHMSRVVAQGDMRPFDTTRGATNEAMEDIRRILASRESLYARADAVVDTAARTVKQSLRDLERAVPALDKETV